MAARNPQYQEPSNSTSSLSDPGSPRLQRTLLSQAVSAALIAGGSSGALQAQVLEEVIVTATKRAESIMDVPIAITAHTGATIRERNFNDVKDIIHFTPGVTGNSKDSFLDNIRVRGIGTNDFGNGGDPSVGMYKNGLYQGRTGSGVFSLYDIERAEFLRGPQGFLFGRGSISGAMNVHTVRPTRGERNGYVELDVGERGVFDLEGATNWDAGENWAFRLAGQHSTEDGYVTNLETGNDLIGLDKTAARFTGVYDNNDNVNVMFLVDYEDRDQAGTVYNITTRDGTFANLESRVNDGPFDVPSDPFEVRIDEADSPIIDIGEIMHYQLEINVDTSFGQFTSLTGYKDHTYNYTEDYDGLPLVIWEYEQDQEGTYFEQEFRLTSDTDGPLSWYAGVSFYEEDITSRFMGRMNEDIYCDFYWMYGPYGCQYFFDYYNYLGGTYVDTLIYYFGTNVFMPSPTGNLDDWNETIGKFSGYAAYLDLNFQITDSFDMSFGVRYSYDEKDFSQEVLSDLNPSPVLGQKAQTGFTTPGGPLTDTQDWSDTTARIAANYRANDNNLLYATIATGYKQGGFNSFTVTPNAVPWGNYVALPDTHKPGFFNEETSVSFELGWKGTLNDGATQIALNYYNYEFEDMQATCGDGAQVVICNIGTLEADGFEGQLDHAFNENWQFGFGFATLNSEAIGIQEFCGGDGERVFGTVDACEGQPIAKAPELSWHTQINMNYPAGNGSIFGSLAWSWEDEAPNDWLPLTPESTTFPESYRMDNGFSIGELVVGYRSNNEWVISAYVENITNEIYYDSSYASGDPVNIFPEVYWGVGRPRTAGMRFSYDF